MAYRILCVEIASTTATVVTEWYLNVTCFMLPWLFPESPLKPMGLPEISRVTWQVRNVRDWFITTMPHNPMPVNLLWVGESALVRESQQPPSDLQDTRVNWSGSGIQKGFVCWHLIVLKDNMHACGGPNPKTHEEKIFRGRQHSWFFHMGKCGYAQVSLKKHQFVKLKKKLF